MTELISGKYEDLILLLARYGAIWFYVFLFVSSCMENFFPPYPGDTVTLVAGLLAVSGLLSPFLVMVAVCGGGLVGCLILYSLGQSKGRKVFMQDKGRFLNRKQLERIERWFAKYGDWTILVSRFLAGVRSGVALAAGIGNIRLPLMAGYSLASIILWNLLLVSSAYLIHNNWRKLYQLTKIYNWVVLLLFGIGILVGIVVFRRKSRK